MALFRSGIGIQDISGSIGGTTFARNRYGAYMRNRVKPTNPKSSRQTVVRAAMADMKDLWAALTQDQRDAWETYGANVSMLNRLGMTIKLTGWNHFVRSNVALLSAAKTVVEDAPEIFSLPETDPTVEITGDESDGKIKVAFNNALTWATEVGAYMLVYGGFPQDPNITFYGGPWRYVGAIAGAAEAPTSPQSFTPPTPVFEGQRIWAKVRIVRADGRLSYDFQNHGLVVA